MSSPVILRIVFGGDDDARKLTLKTGIPKSVDDLFLEIMTVFGVKQKFRLQYKDKDFGNEYINLMSTCQIEDRDTLKVIFLSTDDCNPHANELKISRNLERVIKSAHARQRLCFNTCSARTAERERERGTLRVRACASLRVCLMKRM